MFHTLRFLCLFLSAWCCLAQDVSPHLLLTQRRLHRLKLDRQRQTERWSNFEQRVKSVTDSPERGFELALYSAVTDDQNACVEATHWALAHETEIRQRAIVADWCAKGLADADREKLLRTASDPASTNSFEAARDWLFVEIVRGNATSDAVGERWSKFLPAIQRDPRMCLSHLYALYEFLDAADKNVRTDFRRSDGRLFALLPNIFLLSMDPGDLEKPDWKVRMAGLMMVNLDPNLQGSTFVQGWAMEDPKMVREGPGVAYELLWANPYLPGLGYYNMDEWAYDPPSGLLLARQSWNADACWVSIFHGSVKTRHCSPDVLQQTSNFGKLELMPVKQQCVDVKTSPNGATILSNLKPGATVVWTIEGKKMTAAADSSGLYLVSSNIAAKVCQVNGSH